MVNAEKQELWSKYEKEIDSFVAMKQMTDEILFEAITSCSKVVAEYADNIKCFAERGLLDSVEQSLLELIKSADRLEDTIREAKERAKING